MICIMSVQHTGTWFVIRLLEQLLNQKCFVSEELYQSKSVYPRLAHFHIATPIAGTLKQRPYELATQPDFILQALAQCHKVVIPLRDPIRSLITRQNRHPDLSHIHIVQGFKFLADCTLPQQNVFYLPIDLAADVPQRYHILCELLDFLGVNNGEVDGNIVDQYVTEWQAQNHTSDHEIYKYHDRYSQGNIDFLMGDIGWEIQTLIETPQIKHFLQSHGYLNLPWYDLVKQ